MTDNIVHLPRPKAMRSSTGSLGFYIRVGRNDHREILELLASGERGVFGIVIEAPYAARHKDLITEARKRDLDVILDPKTQQMSMPGSYSNTLRALPWGQSKNHQTIADYDGRAAEEKAEMVVAFARLHRCTHVMSLSHIIEDPNDPWLRRDLAMLATVARLAKGELGVIYSLAFPMALLRDDARRAALVAAIEHAPCEAIWLKIENFGDDASGEKTAAFISACRDFHVHGAPLIGDHLGGLPAQAALAYGAVSGIAHGVTVNQSFKASDWRRPKSKGGGGSERRVYLHELDMLVKPSVATQFLASSPRVRSRHVCGNAHCCAGGMKDMLERPARHALFRRAREVEAISSSPVSTRVPQYLEVVRSVSDSVALAASFDKVDGDFRKKLAAKQKSLGHFRNSMAHLATSSKDVSIAIPPARRAPGAGSE